MKIFIFSAQLSVKESGISIHEMHCKPLSVNQTLFTVLPELKKRKFFLKELELDFIFLLGSFLRAGFVYLSFPASYQRVLDIRIKLMQRNSHAKMTCTLLFFRLWFSVSSMMILEVLSLSITVVASFFIIDSEKLKYRNFKSRQHGYNNARLLIAVQ